MNYKGLFAFCGFYSLFVFGNHVYTRSRDKQPLASEEFKAKVKKIAEEMGGITPNFIVKEEHPQVGMAAMGFNVSWLPPIVYLKKDTNDLIIAHELTHLKYHHSTKVHLASMFAFGIPIELMKNHSMLFRIVTAVGLYGMIFALRRFHENQADRHALKFSTSMGIADAIDVFAEDETKKKISLQTVTGVQGIQNRLKVIFDVHAPTLERIALFEKELERRDEIRPLSIFIKDSANGIPLEIPISDGMNRHLRKIISNSPKRRALINLKQLIINTYRKENQIEAWFNSNDIPSLYDLPVEGAETFSLNDPEEIIQYITQLPSCYYFHCTASRDKFATLKQEITTNGYKGLILKKFIITEETEDRLNFTMILMDKKD
jgi:hypothetical protein